MDRTVQKDGGGQFEIPQVVENMESFGDALVLDRDLSNSACESFRDSLARRLFSNKALLLDAGNVEKIGTGCIQLMLSASLTAARMGVAFSVINSSDALKTAYRDLGLSDRLIHWNPTK